MNHSVVWFYHKSNDANEVYRTERFTIGNCEKRLEIQERKQKYPLLVIIGYADASGMIWKAGPLTGRLYITILANGTGKRRFVTCSMKLVMGERRRQKMERQSQHSGHR